MSQSTKMPPHDCSVDKRLLGLTSISVDHVQQAFREYLNDEQIRLRKADAETIAAGQGFTSFILRLNLVWSDEDKKKHGDALPRSAILKALSKDAIEKLLENFKVGGTDTVRHDFTQMFVTSHKTECAVYGMFGRKSAKPPVPIAHAYATWTGDSTHPPMILLEDLGHKARVLGDGTASLSFEQMLSLAEILASLHAWCLITEETWSDKVGKFEDRAKMFEGFKPMVQAGLQKAKETFPELFAKLDDAKFVKLFELESMLKMHDAFKPYTPDVLVHGDFWANNIMFNKLPDGSMGDEVIAVIDWQLPHSGSPALDFGRMFSQSYDPHLYELHMDAIVRRYFDTLQKRSGVKMPVELTFDRVLKLVQDNTALSCIMMFLMQDALQSALAPGDSQEEKAKRERVAKRVRDGFAYATTILDVTVSGDRSK